MTRDPENCGIFSDIYNQIKNINKSGYHKSLQRMNNL